MKMTSFIVTTFVAALFWQCTSDKKTLTQSYKTVITGKIANRNVYPQIKTLTLNISDLRAKEFTVSDTINQDGSFRFEFDLYQAQDITIQELNSTLIAHPGDQMNIDIDFKQLDNIKFSGDAALTNEQLQNYLLNNASIIDIPREEKKTLTLNTLKPYLKKWQESMFTKLDTFASSLESPTSDFITYARNRITTNYLNNIIGLGHKIEKELYQKGEYTIDKNFYFDLHPEIESLLTSKVLYSKSLTLAELYISIFYTIKDAFTMTGKQMKDSTFSHIKTSLKSQRLKELMLAGHYFNEFCQNKIDQYEEDSVYRTQHITSPNIKAQLAHFYKVKKQLIINPPLAPGAVLKETGDVTADSLFAKIISENKGKLVYVDIWATWCGPCKRQFPYMKRYEEDYKDKPIAFVSLCTYSPRKIWKVILSEHQLTGTNYFCSKALSESLKAKLGYTGIPYFVLIDKNGTIVKQGNDLKPSHTSTKETIDKLL